jgi:hypothetical protein
MPTKSNKKVKENYYCNNNDSNRACNINNNEQSGNTNWWFNELDFLGIKKKSGSSSSNNEENNNNESELPTSQQLEDLTDDIKQTFIRDYKVCYSQ